MFRRLASFTERHAALVIAGWVIAAAALALTAPSLQKVGTQDQTAFLPSGSPSQRADVIMRRLFPDDPTLDAGIIVLARPHGLASGDDTYIAQLTAWLQTGPLAHEIKTVQSAATNPAAAALLRSSDNAAALVVVGFRTPPFTTQTNAVVDRVRHHLDATAPAGLVHHLTGTGGLAADQASGLVSSFQRTAIITVLLVLLILVFVYRSLVAPLIPLVTIGIAFVVSRGIVGLLAAHGFKVASMAETFIVVMIFGAGTDYCLFIVSRYRQDLADGDPLPATLQRSMTVVGAVIAASAVTVIVGFLSQLTAKFGIYKTMGPAMGVAIFITLVAGLTLTPALLRVAGAYAFWPGEMVDRRGGKSSARWTGIAERIKQQPVEVLLAGIIMLLLPASGLGWFRMSFDLVREIPPSADARQGFNTIADHYPAGTLAPIYVVIDADGPITDDARLTAIDQLTDKLRAQPGIGQVRSITQPAGAPLTLDTMRKLGTQGGFGDVGIDPNKVDIGPLVSAMGSPAGLRFTGPILRAYPQLAAGPLQFFLGANGTSTRVLVELNGSPYARQALPLIRGLDETVNRALAGSALSGAHLAVGGPASFFVDIQDIGNADFRVMSAVLIAGIFIVLALLLRSVVAPFYLLASVVLSYAATMGLCTLLFVVVLGDPGISFFLPPFLFIILVALGADYNIFIMSRIREEADDGFEVHEAVIRGLSATGRVITSAGIILAGTFAVLVAAPLPQLRQIGFGVTVGVLIDTFLVRTLIVPATTMILGRWAFWPGIPGEKVKDIARGRNLGFATAGVVALVVALVALVASTGSTTTITRIASSPTGNDIRHASEAPSSVAGAALVASPTSAAPSPGASTTIPSAAHPSPTATTAATVVQRIAIPNIGAWRYHLQGTRKIGAAGSAQPFSEDATSQVSRESGDAQVAQMRVVTQSSNGKQDDLRRYAPADVQLVATQISSSSMSFGGTLQPPPQLVRWPIKPGDAWTSDWNAGSVTGHSTARVLGNRTVTVAGNSYTCWDIQTDTSFSGSAQGNQHSVSCWAPSLGMSIDDQTRFQGTYSGVPFDISTHSVLISAP